jgi:hypothetical protein
MNTVMPAWKHQKVLQLNTTGLRLQQGAPQAFAERQRELWATFSTSDIEAVSSKVNAGSTAPAYVAGRCSSSGVVNRKPVRTDLSSNHSCREPAHRTPPASRRGQNVWHFGFRSFWIF